MASNNIHRLSLFLGVRNLGVAPLGGFVQGVFLRLHLDGGWTWGHEGPLTHMSGSRAGKTRESFGISMST